MNFSASVTSVMVAYQIILLKFVSTNQFLILKNRFPEISSTQIYSAKVFSRQVVNTTINITVIEIIIVTITLININIMHSTIVEIIILSLLQWLTHLPQLLILFMSLLKPSVTVISQITRTPEILIINYEHFIKVFSNFNWSFFSLRPTGEKRAVKILTLVLEHFFC